MLLVIEYILVASLVIFCSIKASQYIDMLDKTTKMSGAFLGGVLLSAVTSLPELFTSISATVLLHKPGLCIGNILGSNIFNLAVLALASLWTMRYFKDAKISKGNIFVTAFVLLIYIALLLNMFNILRFEIATIDVVTIAIIFIYAFGVRYLAKDGGNETSDEEVTLSTRQIVVRFFFTSVVIVVLSVVMTYITDDLAAQYNIGAGLAGALFLGVATSLPEVSSTIALFRMRSYNIAVGNIVGSNLFNFLVLCVADILCFSESVYDFSDMKVVGLLEYGLCATIFTLPMLYSKSRWVKILSAILVFACYIAFLVR